MKTKPTDKNTDETPVKSAPEPVVNTKAGSAEPAEACAMPATAHRGETPQGPGGTRPDVSGREDSLGELQKLQKEIESLRKAATERDEFLKLLQRVQADFSNYQKRIKSERECWDKYQDENLLRELLPAFDNFGRTLKLECTTNEAKCIMDGVTLIKHEVFRILEKRGLKQMKTIGEKFDPNLHEAVAMTESAEHKDHEILEEVVPGFMLNDRLIRAAKVRIASKPKPKEDRGATASSEHRSDRDSELKTSGEPQKHGDHKDATPS